MLNKIIYNLKKINQIKKVFREDYWKTIINRYSCGFIMIRLKKKPDMYTRAFVKIYNWRSKELVNKIHKMVKLEKYQFSGQSNI